MPRRRSLIGVITTIAMITPNVALANCQSSPVIMITQPGCEYCAAAAQLFRQNGIRYSTIDFRDPRAARYALWGTPIILVENQAVRGYAERTLRRVLCLE